MKGILNFFSRFSFRPVTVADAIADLDKAVTKLQQAEDFHYRQTTQFIYEAEVATKLAADHEYASVRAARVRTKLADLIG